MKVGRDLGNFAMKLASVGAMSHDVSFPASDLDLDDVVEIGILLPANRAAALIQIAQNRQESVGHLLRKMIDRELMSQRCTG